MYFEIQENRNPDGTFELRLIFENISEGSKELMCIFLVRFIYKEFDMNNTEVVVDKGGYEVGKFTA